MKVMAQGLTLGFGIVGTVLLLFGSIWVINCMASAEPKTDQELAQARAHTICLNGFLYYHSRGPNASWLAPKIGKFGQFERCPIDDDDGPLPVIKKENVEDAE